MLLRQPGDKKGDPMSTPIARYTVLVDRYLTEDCDGTGTLHDGTGEGAVAQLTAELQEGWDAAAIGGHFRVIKRVVSEDGYTYLPGGYAGKGLFGSYCDDPDAYRPTPRYGVQTLMAGNDTMFSDIEVTLWAVVDQLSDPEQAKIIMAVYTDPTLAAEAAKVLNSPT
jgi:hypothetical protein